ncbi:MAG: L-2-hydroxyglutarate oxidase [Bdellovibrionales bacterium]|nr:L-2-hydroxyglutarate oxidase [Bdellovibrionales bacterium]
MMAVERYDLLVIGAGIVGLATAFRFLERFPGKRVVVLEKEADIARHQSGHNSGVIHAGTYYRPGSLKAENCRLGMADLLQFCAEETIPYNICGKVIVAVDAGEVPRLHNIFARGQANGVRCRLISQAELHEKEPHVRGIEAIFVEEEGIIDFPMVCTKLRSRIERAGGGFRFSSRLLAARPEGNGVILETDSGELFAHSVANCAGLHADRVARILGSDPSVKIVPFRGEYFELREAARHLCRALIYPVPNPNFPFLGVHYTRTIHDHVKCGPNAVLAFSREGYTKTTVSFGDLWESLTYSGFLRLAGRYWSEGAMEMWRSVSRRAFLRALQGLVPEVRDVDLLPGPTGVRAQAVSRDGKVVDDFVFEGQGRILHVLNAPSPAPTASLNIGRAIVDRLC